MFQINPMLVHMRILLLLRYVRAASAVTDICCIFGLPVNLPSKMIDNQLGDKQINS